jgi:hypothetical protein
MSGPALMSQQRFSDIHRSALWEAHRKRCLYCGEPLRFKELFVDHVIPEKTAKNANQLADVRISHGLGADFDIAGDENLAPACYACNTRKSDLLFPPEHAALILKQVAVRLPKFNRLKARYQEQASVEDLMRGVSVALEKRLISPAEVTDILHRSQTGDLEVNLYRSLPFVGDVSVAALRRSEVDRLFDEPLALPGHPQPLDVEHADGRTREIRTTREYRDAIAQGFIPTCNVMVKIATLFDLPLAVFTAMERAQPARASFIREPRTGIIDLKHMPVFMLPMGQISQEDSDCKTLEEVQTNGNLKVISSTSHSLHIEYDHFSRIIVEIMRADLDEDGIEDILVYWYDSSLQGTYGDGGTFVLTRRTADAPFERLSSWPEWKTPLQLWYSDIPPGMVFEDIMVSPT